MKTFVIGDIHGAYKSLLQCLERSEFDDQKDRLIVSGTLRRVAGLNKMKLVILAPMWSEMPTIRHLLAAV